MAEEESFAPAVSELCSSASESNENVAVVIVARHGERLDYDMRDSSLENWCSTSDRPWDPPLTDHGVEQGRKLGEHLATEFFATTTTTTSQRKKLRKGLDNDKKNKDDDEEEDDCDIVLPPLSAVYSSPFYRCRQTAVAAMMGYNDVVEREERKGRGGGGGGETETTTRVPPVRVEMGLAESINESWYRSWSLPESNGTWGFKPRDGRYDIIYDDDDILHPLSKEPVHPLLDWKAASSTSSSSWIEKDTTEGYMDVEYESATRIEKPYRFGGPNTRLLESRKDQQRRMMEAVEKLAVPGRAVMLVSHGGPVTHLYEEMTGNNWRKHGPSSYCCYTVYVGTPTAATKTTTTTTESNQHDAGDDINNNNLRNNANNRDMKWDAVRVNQSDYLKEEIVKYEKHVSDGDAVVNSCC